MAKVCCHIFIFTSFVLALANCQRDQALPSCSSSSFVSNSSCFKIIYNMIDCVSFLSAGGASTKPDASCCSGFKSVLKADADCICQAIKDAPLMGIKLNMTRAAELPSECGVLHFSASKICGFSDSPGASPAKSPKPSLKTPVPPPTKATRSPLPPTKSPIPSPRTKTAPAPTPPATKTPVVPSPKSPVSSLPKSKSHAPTSLVAEGGRSQAPAPAPANSKSGSYSLSAYFAVVISLCAIYVSFITV